MPDWSICLGGCLAVAGAIASNERLEEDRAAASAKLRAHVRTGTYSGDRRIGALMRPIPAAVTLCGGEATGKDHNPTGAREIIRDAAEPWLSDMCPACRAKLEGNGAKDLSHLPGRSGSATVKQRAFIRHLLEEGARAGRPGLMDARQIDKLSGREASAKIDDLIALKARGWKGDL